MANSKQGTVNGAGGVSAKTIVGAICLIIASGGTVGVLGVNRDEVSRMIAAEAPYSKDKSMIKVKFDEVTRAIQELKVEVRALRDKLGSFRGRLNSFGN